VVEKGKEGWGVGGKTAGDMAEKEGCGDRRGIRCVGWGRGRREGMAKEGKPPP